MGASTNLKPTYTSLASCTSWTHPLFFYITKVRYPKPCGFCQKQRTYKTTCLHSHAKRTECTKPHDHNQPINWNLIPRKDAMIPQKAQIHHLLNSQVLAIFPPSATIPATLHYPGFENLPTLSTRWYVIVFYIFYIFYNLAHIHFQYISWITSPTQPPLHQPHLRPSTIQQILPIT